jgi:parvulin-like peptidyl-prolyl isomerase
VKNRNNHWMMWTAIAAGALAVFSLSALAQYPVGPGDNGVGTSPMAPMSQSEVPRYGEGYNRVMNAPFAPVTTTRPGNWVGSPAPQSSVGQVSNLSAEASNRGPIPADRLETRPTPGATGILPVPAGAYPQTNAPPQTPLQWSAPINPQNVPANYPSTVPNQFAPANPPAGQLGGLGANPALNEFLNQSGAPQLNLSTETLARVGSQGIFASEITPTVDRYLAEFKAKLSPEEIELHREEFETQRGLLIKQILKTHIESKLIFQDVKRDIPTEGMGNVNKTLTNLFEKNELPKLMKRDNVTTIKELEQKLNVYGSSLAQEKSAFIEKSLVGEWVRRQVKAEELPTVTQMTLYYEAHKDDFTTPAKVRWEELTVNKAKYAAKEEALAAIAQMGNRVLVGGEPLAEVAKQSSDGFTAIKGGYRDWISPGSLTDKEIEKALFSPTLPVGQLSQIIETPQEYTILRVLERVDRKTEDFLAAQEKIGKKITEQRNDRQFREYLERLERRTPIWTIYDGDGGGLSLAERLKEDSSKQKIARRYETRR